ncbi:von Willebrand factor type A domain-containing protein [Jimgerdemannia flammicorona]|uniref:von Willebrand factor type A domain-containing protein n=1 Tax=Jimgerdemannia flammicorona TaxID=994334 RepID=A0A433CVM9_9FUNG|nr:von Willebrand factor type A domain-containing protein [Jimgerdemannia flammicorona]
MQLHGLLYFVGNVPQPQALPLQNVHAKVKIIDMIAQVKLSQTYSNTSTSTIEAIYKFPLPESAAVNAFEVEFSGGRKVLGKVEEKQKAQRIYENAIQVGEYRCRLVDNSTRIMSVLIVSRVYSQATVAIFWKRRPPKVIFEMKVGNLLPSEILTVHICYVQELPNDTLTDDLVRFSLPTTIAPRYQARNTSASAREATGVAYSNSARSYTLGMDVTCRMSGRVLDISSTSHDITKNLNLGKNGKVASAALANSYECLDKVSWGRNWQDFILLVKAEGLDNPRAFAEYNSETDTNCVMLTMVPRFALTEIRSELIFVVDRSGSMEGPKIRKTSEALTLFLRSLPEDSYFNIVSFGSSYKALFPHASASYSHDNLQKALSLVNRLDASMGGTEILHPLDWACSNARRDVSTTVLLLTDGEVSNASTVIDRTKRHVRDRRHATSKGLRVFTLGVGNSVSHQLVDGVARMGRGYSQYVGETERLERKIVQMLKNALQSPVTDYKVTWTADEERINARGVSEKKGEEGRSEPKKKILSFFNPKMKVAQDDIAEPSELAVPTVRQSPHYIPVILAHSRLVVYCFLAPGQKPRGTIFLEGQSDDGPIEVEIDLETAEPGTLIHTLAARRMITEIEEETSYLHHDDSGNPRQVSSAMEKREIVTMGLQFSLASNHTSFVAVDKRAEGDEIHWQQIVQVNVPSVMPGSMASYAMLGGFSSFRSSRQASVDMGSEEDEEEDEDEDLETPFSRFSMISHPPDNVLRGSTTAKRAKQRVKPKIDVVMLGADDNAALRVMPVNPSIQDLHALIDFQSFDGSFVVVDELAIFLGFKGAKEFLSQTRPKDSVVRNEDVWTTLYVIAFLEERVSEFKEEWELVVSKALRWVKKQNIVGVTGEVLVKEIRKIVPKP